MKPHRGAIVLLYGILGLVICPLLSVAAWLMASADLKEMALHEMDSSGRSLTNTGRILGIIGTAVMFAVLLYFAGKILLSPWG